MTTTTMATTRDVGDGGTVARRRSRGLRGGRGRGRPTGPRCDAIGRGRNGPTRTGRGGDWVAFGDSSPEGSPAVDGAGTRTRAMSGMGSSSSGASSGSAPVAWTTSASVGRVALACALATRMRRTSGDAAWKASSARVSSSVGVTVRAVSDSEDSRSSSSSTTSSSSSTSSNAWLYEDEKKLGSPGGALDGVASRNGGGDSSATTTAADGSDAATRVREGSSRHERHAGHYLSKPYAVYRIDAKGQRVPYKQIMTRRQLLRDTDLSPRDLRRIDPTLGQTTNTPAVIVREDSVLVNLGVRIIICADHALLLEPDTMMSVNFLESWTSRSSAAPEGSSSEGMEVLPFELTMVEAALQETCAQLENRLEHCTRRYRALERKLQTGIEKTTFDELRFMKQALVQLESRASAVRDELLETLDDEDDIERMTLSSAATGEAKEEEQEEVENLLEYYVQQTEAVHSATEALLENTRDLDESISVTLSARRLEVSKIELMLSIASFAAAIGAVVTGIFGMNLTSTLESSVAAFYLCTSLLLSSCIGMSAWLYRFCKKRNIL